MTKSIDLGIRLVAAALPDLACTLGVLLKAGRHLDYVSMRGHWDRFPGKATQATTSRVLGAQQI